jgi:hypothetical protein
MPRLARRIRPLRWNKTIRANSKKNNKRIRENHDLIKSLAK